jgi:O-succinylbenzoate synthase
VLNDDSTITVPDTPGTGVAVLPERLRAVQVREMTIGKG